ncbi:MAG: hypothetical protein A2W22_02785 [Candidatus Levybacteria bacterium RBG_16_35_11]|nr:MAG: hypothetical protein A2W22_02785 [Candidatus Levybacteria bacterium RBG_16_35_11]
MTFSIIIPTKDRTDDLKNCVRSIIKQTVLPQELIIVDASSDSIGAVNQENCKKIIEDKVKLIYIKSTPGSNRQRNTGADHACGEIIFFIDDDIVLKEDYFEKILEVYEIKKALNTGGVQGTTILNYFNQTWISRTFRKLFFMTRASISEKSRFLPSLGYVYISMPKEIIEVEAMSSGLCSYYKNIFNEFRFDEKFEACQDLEISYRVSRKYKLFQTPYALLTHNHSTSTHLSSLQHNKRHIINTYRLAKKYLPKRNKNWLAYYWSVLGEIILSAAKSCVKFSFDPLIGTLSGIKYILMNEGKGS